MAMGCYIYIAIYLRIALSMRRTGRSCETAIQEFVRIFPVLGAHASHAVYCIANDINIYIRYIYSNYNII